MPAEVIRAYNLKNIIMGINFLQQNMGEVVRDLKDLGVFIAMFLESSIIPIPSEAVIIGAGALGISVVSIVIFGSLGSTMGAMVGYALGRFAAKPMILKFGKLILIKPHHIDKAEAFAKKHGPMSVFIGRILPIVPFKVFSIAAGITKIPFGPFVLFTLIGVVPRMFLLAMFGQAIVKYTKPTVLIVAFAVLIFIAWKISSKLQADARQRKP